MHHKIRTLIVGTAAAAALAGGVAPAAQGQTIQRQLLCDGAENNALSQNVGVIDCANGEYDPETENYKPYDPATDDNGLLGLNNTLGRDFFGL